MARIITNQTVQNLEIKSHSNDHGPSFEDAKEFGPAIAREPNFAELHALFEIQYKQFLTDTSDEAAKCAQRLLELESIVYGKPSTKRVTCQTVSNQDRLSDKEL